MKHAATASLAAAGFVVGLAAPALATSYTTADTVVYGNSSSCARGQGSVNDTTHKSGAVTKNYAGCTSNSGLALPAAGWVVAGTRLFRDSVGLWCSAYQDGGNAQPAPVEPTAPPEPGTPLTIGPWAKGKEAPDLVPIDLDNGISGFLRTYDMAHGSENPQFVRRVSDTETETETVLPVYEEDGQTVIGEFVSGTTSSE